MGLANGISLPPTPDRYMTDNRLAAGIDVDMLDTNALLTAALELGEQLDVAGERCMSFAASRPCPSSWGKELRSLGLVQKVDDQAVRDGDLRGQHRLKLIPGFSAIYRREDGVDPDWINRTVAELAGSNQAIELGQGERVSNRPERRMQSLSPCCLVTRNRTDLLERAFGVGLDAHREPGRRRVGNRTVSVDRVSS